MDKVNEVSSGQKEIVHSYFQQFHSDKVFKNLTSTKLLFCTQTRAIKLLLFFISAVLSLN